MVLCSVYLACVSFWDLGEINLDLGNWSSGRSSTDKIQAAEAATAAEAVVLIDESENAKC